MRKTGELTHLLTTKPTPFIFLCLIIIFLPEVIVEYLPLAVQNENKAHQLKAHQHLIIFLRLLYSNC